MSRSTFLAVFVAATWVAPHADAQGSDEPATSQTSSYIVGGTDVPPGKWPDTVAVLGSRGACTGTLIAPKVVLTAGHCADIRPAIVIADTIDYARPGGARAGVARTVAFPDWQTTYDVAVVVLSEPITDVTPRRIATYCTYRELMQDTLVHLVGFGLTEASGTGTNTALKEALTAVIDPVCVVGNGCNPEISPGGEFIAGGTGGADSCFGDSGGPVYLDTNRGPIVVGAVSRSVASSPTPCGGGGIYVRTDNLIEWIEDVAGAAVAKDTCAADTGDDADGAPGDGSGEDYADVGDLGGGCTTSPGSGSSLLALAALGLIARRRGLASGMPDPGRACSRSRRSG